MDARAWHRQARAAAAPPPGSRSTLLADTAGGSAREVARLLRAGGFPSPKHDAVARALDADLAVVENEPPGARTFLSLSAPYTVGKSTLIKAWAQRLHLSWLGGDADQERPVWFPEPGVEADHVPVVYVTLMARTNAKDLYAALLAFLGYPSVGVSRSMTLRVTQAIHAHRVRLIVLDDAHMLNTASITGRQTLDAIKQLNTELGEVGGTMVLVGAHLRGGGVLSDPQIRGRLLEHELAPYNLDASQAIGEWQDFLTGCEQVLTPYLPSLAPGTLPTELGAVIWRRTQGFVGDTCWLLAEATASAWAAGRRRTITADSLATIRISQRAHDAEAELIAARRRSRRRNGPDARRSLKVEAGR